MNLVTRTLMTVALGAALLVGSTGTAMAAPPTDTHGPTGGTATTGGASTGDATELRPRVVPRPGTGATNTDCKDIYTALQQANSRLREATEDGDDVAKDFWERRLNAHLKEFSQKCRLLS